MRLADWHEHEEKYVAGVEGDRPVPRLEASSERLDIVFQLAFVGNCIETM